MRSPQPLFASAALLLALAVFLARIDPSAFQPDSDQTYYLLIARRLAAGEGLSEPVVWHFLRPPDAIPHPSNDYWMPLTSIVLAPFVGLGGDAAGFAPILFFALLTILGTYALGLALLRDPRLAFAAAAFTALDERVRYFAATTDSTPLYVSFVLAAVLAYDRAAGAAKRGAGSGLLLGAAAGGAVWARSDATSVLPAMVILALLVSVTLRAPRPSRSALVAAMAMLLAIVLPWAVRCKIAFGTFWTPAAAKAPFLAAYHQALQYGVPIDAQTALARVLADPGRAVATRSSAVALELTRFLAPLPAVLWPLAVVGVVVVLRDRRPAAIASASLVGAVALVYGVVVSGFASVGGGFRSSICFVPFAIVVAIAGARLVLERVLSWERAGGALSRAERGTQLFSIGLAALAVVSAVAIGAQEIMGRRHDRADPRPERLHAAAVALGPASAAPLMTNEPIEVSYVTGRTAVMVPLNGPVAICAVARRYGAEELLLIDDDLLRSRLGSDLGGLMRGELGALIFPRRAAGEGWARFGIACDRLSEGGGERAPTRTIADSAAATPGGGIETDPPSDPATSMAPR